MNKKISPEALRAVTGEMQESAFFPRIPQADVVLDQTEESDHGTMTPQPSTPEYDVIKDVTKDSIEDVVPPTAEEFVAKRLADYGKKAASYRFTDEERDDLKIIVSKFWANDRIDTTANEIMRIAVNQLIHEYKIKGKDSSLAQILKKLNPSSTR